jgi:uncharacterized protein
MTTESREFQIFAKPVGADCNLRCSYCYYINNPGSQGTGLHLMDDRILEQYIRQNSEASSGNQVIFSWHGGEPLMAGIHFFRKVIKLQKTIIPSGKQVLNGIQTNGTLINAEWADFLAGEGFFTGISIDGPPDLHDTFRRTTTGLGTSEKVLRGYELLKKKRVPAEILCVVSPVNSGHPLEVYNFFKKLDAKFITFLPLVYRPALSGEGGTGTSVDPLEFGVFLSTVFDEWKEKDIGTLKVQIFEEALRSAFDQPHTLCIFRERCGGVPVLEQNGNFYSCDHFADHEHLVGNIMEGSIAGFLGSERQRAFGDAKWNSLASFCLNCPVLKMCNGECPKNRFARTPEGDYGLNYLCEGYKYFFTRCKPFADAVSAAWKLSLRSGG